MFQLHKIHELLRDAHSILMHLLLISIIAFFTILLITAYVIAKSNITQVYTSINTDVKVITAYLQIVNDSSAVFTITLSNPTNNVINFTGFTLGNLICVFPTPIAIKRSNLFSTYTIDLVINNNEFLKASYNNESLICNGTEPVLIGTEYVSYIMTTNGTILLIMIATPVSHIFSVKLPAISLSYS